MKYIIPVWVLLALAGCVKEQTTQPTPEPAKGTFTFTSRTGEVTKVTVNADNSLYWAAGDQIDVYSYKDADIVCSDVALLTSGEGTGVGTFTPKAHGSNTDWFNGGDAAGQVYTFYAFCPGADPVASPAEKVVSLDAVAAAQSESQGIGKYIITYATASTTKSVLQDGTAPNFAFSPKTALLKLTIRNNSSHATNISSVKLVATGGNIAGTASLNLGTGVLSEGSGTTITYTPAEPIRIAANATASVPVKVSLLPCAATNLAVSFEEDGCLYPSVDIAFSSVESGKVYSKSATISSPVVREVSIANSTAQTAKSDVLEANDLYYGSANSVVVASDATSFTIDIKLYSAGANYVRQSPQANSTSYLTAVTSAKIIWAETDLYNDTAFKITGATLEKLTLSKTAGVTGNALVGIYDADGKVLWSFHVWVPADNSTVPPQDNGQTGTKAQYSSAYNLALGQITNGHDAYMYYQWGRKDPLGRAASFGSATPGLTATYGDGPAEAKQIAATATGYSLNNLTFARQNPETYITQTGDNTYDWYPVTDGGHSVQNDNLWGAGTDETKTIYDPCPENYHLPASNRLWYNDGNWTPTYTDGLYFSTWGMEYVRGGYRSRSSAQAVYVASYGYYWSAQAVGGSSVNAYYLSFNASTAYPANGSNRAYGFGVRCVKN